MCLQERPPAYKDREVSLQELELQLLALLPRRQRQAELQYWNLVGNIADLDRELYLDEYDEEYYEEYDEEYEEEDYDEYYGEYQGEGYQEEFEEENEKNEENGEEEYIPPPAATATTPNDHFSLPLPPSLASDNDEEDRQPDEETRELEERLRLVRERRAALDREMEELNRLMEGHNVE